MMKYGNLIWVYGGYNFLLMEPEHHMDPYSTLLEEFHILERENNDNQEYMSLLNELRIQKQSKISQLKRKQNQHAQLLQKVQTTEHVPIEIQKLNEEVTNFQNEKMIAKINEEIMLKEENELNKIINNLKQDIEVMESQLRIFNRKENDIKHYLCQSKRNLEEAHCKVKNQKLQNNQLHQKLQKQSDNLQNQKQNLHQQLHYLANSAYAQNKKSSGKQLVNISKLLLNNLAVDLLDSEISKMKAQAYTKKKLQELLRGCYVILRLKTNWQEKIHQRREIIEEQIRSVSQFRIYSKIQILHYYQMKGVQVKSALIADQIMKFYYSITESIQRYEKASDQLNTSYKQLKFQNQFLDQSLDKLEQNKQKIALIAFTETEKDILKFRKKVDENCGIIFRFSMKIFNFIRKILRLEDLCHLIKAKQKDRDKKLQQTDYFHHELFHLFLGALKKSPQEIIVQWNQCLKNYQKGKIFIERLTSNDIFRSFARPQHFNHEKDVLENEKNYSHKIFYLQKNLLSMMKNLICSKFIEIKKHSEQLTQKSNKLMKYFQTDVSSFLVESKEYYRRDDYKFLEKMQRIQLKKRGLYIPPKFERGDDELNENDGNKKRNLIHFNKVVSERLKPRGTAPINSNFVSSYRQKVNKADKKIRDLLSKLSQKKQIRNFSDLEKKKKFQFKSKSWRKDLNEFSGLL